MAKKLKTAKVATVKKVLEALEDQHVQMQYLTQSGSMCEYINLKELVKVKKVLKLAIDKIKELEKKSGYSTTIAYSQCNNCGDRR